MKKRITLAIVVLALVHSAIAIPFATPASFFDLPPTHWAYGNVGQMVDVGIIKGYPDGTFRPDNKVTYGEFIPWGVLSRIYQVFGR